MRDRPSRRRCPVSRAMAITLVGAGHRPIPGRASTSQTTREVSHELDLLRVDRDRGLRGRGGGGDRLDEAGRMDGQLLGPGRDPCPGGGRTSAAADATRRWRDGAAGDGTSCATATSSSGSATPGPWAASSRSADSSPRPPAARSRTPASSPSRTARRWSTTARRPASSASRSRSGCSTASAPWASSGSSPSIDATSPGCSTTAERCSSSRSRSTSGSTWTTRRSTASS